MNTLNTIYVIENADRTPRMMFAHKEDADEYAKGVHLKASAWHVLQSLVEAKELDEDAAAYEEAK